MSDEAGGLPPPGPPPAAPPEQRPARRSPRRLRSLIIGLVVAGGLAAFLFLGLGSGPGSGNGQAAVVGVGSVAPNFTLPSLGGGPAVTLDALGVDRHRPVVLNFFASWCIPCRAETPMLGSTAAAEAAKHSIVQFVGVDVNDPQTGAALDFVHQSGVTYPVGADLTLRVTSALYGLNAQPNTFFIDATGHVVGHTIGALTQDQLDQWLHRLAGAAG